MHMRLRTWLHKYASVHMDLYCNSFIFHWILFIFNQGHSRCGAYPSSQQVWGRKKPNRMYSHKLPLKTTKSMQDIMNQTWPHTHGAPAASWVLPDSIPGCGETSSSLCWSLGQNPPVPPQRAHNTSQDWEPRARSHGSCHLTCWLCKNGTRELLKVINILL